MFTRFMPLSLGVLIAAAACGRSTPKPSGAEAGTESATRCEPSATAKTASAAKSRRRFRLDWNGDGIDDLALAAGGGVSIWLGSRAALEERPAIHLAAPAGSDGFGRVLIPIGDLDADGFGDLVIAAPSTTIPGRTRKDGEFPAGAVFLYRGGRSEPAPERLTVIGTGKHLGSSLGVGDLDADGRPEFVAATPTWFRSERGRLPRVRAGVDVYGADLVPHALWPEERDAADVMDIAGGGDLDGDGCDDVVVRVGRWDVADDSDPIELRVYTGGTGGIDAARSRVLARSNLGGSPEMLVVPNLAGDGRAAVAFGRSDGGVSVARFDPSGGTASSTDLAFPNALVRIAYLATGDFDADGRSELVGGSHQSGDIVVYRGGRPAAAPIALGRPPDARLFPLGLSVGDFDGDGHDDLAATSSRGGVAAPDRFWIYRGDATNLLEGPVGSRDIGE